jgi:hypothetical protein
MMDVSDKQVSCDKPAVLQYRESSTARFVWCGEQFYDGTVGGAVRCFKQQPEARQEHTEMFVDVGVIEGLEEDTIIGSEVLHVLAQRPDLPQHDEGRC